MARTPGLVWTTFASICIAALLGLYVGLLLGQHDALQLDTKIPVADLATVIISIIALVLVPTIVSRFERRGAFDRRAVTDHLAPARTAVLRIDEILSDTLASEDDIRQRLISEVRVLRTNLGLARRIVERWQWPEVSRQELESAEALARNLDRIATGDQRPSRAADAAEISRQLHDVLLDLLRGTA